MPRTNFPIRSLMIVSLSALTLAACGTSGGDDMAQKTSAPLPPVAEMDAAMAAPAPMPLSGDDTLTPVMTPAPASSVPVPPMEDGTVTMVTTTSGPVDATVEARMAKMEATVNSLRADYDRIMPAFASLNTTNDRIQKLLDEMEAEGKIPPGTADKAMTTTTTQATTTKIVTPAAPESPGEGAKTETAAKTVTTTTTMEKTAAPAASPASAAGNTVTAVRIGEHGAKTRLVFDLTSKTKPEFKYDLDNAEKILMVEMPSSAWTARQSGKPNSPLVSGWTAQKSPSGGMEVAVQLKKNARVLSTEFLPAEGKDPARLVMDIASGG